MGLEYGMVQDKFDQLIEDNGKLVRWQAGYRCSCWVFSSSAPKHDCKACHGIGFIYQDPVNVKALLTGIDLKKDFLPAGEWTLGDVTCTVPNKRKKYTITPDGTSEEWEDNPMWGIGQSDLVTLPDSEQRTSEVLTRGEPMWHRAADTLLHPSDAILSIVAVSVSDSVAGTVTYLQEAEAGDYTVDDQGVVTWNGSAVSDFTVLGNVVHFNPNGNNAALVTQGAQYSVTYYHLTTYIVYQNIPQARDHYGQKMPRKVVLKLRGVGAAGGYA